MGSIGKTGPIGQRNSRRLSACVTTSLQETYYTDQIDNDRNLIQAGEQTEIPSGALSYRAGAVYQPTNKWSIFAAYSNYFKPSRTVTPNGQIF